MKCVNCMSTVIAASVYSAITVVNTDGYDQKRGGGGGLESLHWNFDVVMKNGSLTFSHGVVTTLVILSQQVFD